MELKQAYLKCERYDKLKTFSDTTILKYKDYYGNELEGFFDETNIHKEGLLVTIIKEEGDRISIVTPQEFINHTHFVQANKADLVYRN